MLNLKIKFIDETKKVIKKAQQGNFKSLSHAAASIRKDVIESIEDHSDEDEKNVKINGKVYFYRKKSKPGTPPFSHRRHGLKDSIVFDVDKQEGTAFIGPNFRQIANLGQVHEFGGIRYGRKYPARPFMGPALKRAKPRLPAMWANIFS